MAVREVNHEPRLVEDIGGPYGIAFGQNGIWAVADNPRQCVYIYDEQNRRNRRQVGGFGSDYGLLGNPHGIAFDSNNNLYVAEYGGGRITVIFDVNGDYRYRSHFNGHAGSVYGELRNPAGITIHNNKVYVADNAGGSRIPVFNRTNGQFSHIIRDVALLNPCDVTVANDQLLVCHFRNAYQSCILKFQLDGTPVCGVNQFAEPGAAEGQLNEPISLTTDANGLILVAEYGQHCVSVFNPDGTFNRCFGFRGNGIGQFTYPQGVAISPNGELYVSDRDNHRVQIFPAY